jgi:hypothetical protein
MSGYLIEVTPGRELLYRTTWALREAMRSGEVTADSRIFHRASSQWISITEHPEYRRFLTDRQPPAWLQPADPVEAEPPEPEPAGPGWLVEVLQRVTARWTEFKRRLSTPRRKAPRLRAKTPAAPPETPAEPPRTPDSTPTRDRWTYFP